MSEAPFSFTGGRVAVVNRMIVPGDVSIVRSARQSYGRGLVSLSDIPELSSKDIGVIEMMMDKRHGTPFEAYVMSFSIRCTIKEARDWFRYRFASYNEYSTRFSKRIKENYLLPAHAMRQDVKGIDGRNHVVMIDPNDEDNRDQMVAIQDEMIAANNDAERHYTRLLELGLAQEAASYVYNLAQMTEFTWTINVRGLLNFLSQRMDGAALYELRLKAYEVYRLSEPMFPETMRLWTKYRQPDMFTDWHDEPYLDLPEELQ